MHRWIAKFAVLLMLVPTFGPLALARAVPMEGMHCMRRPLGAPAAPGAEPAMHCHEGMAQPAKRNSEESSEKPSEKTAASSASSEASLRSPDCCRNHDCCRGVATSEWARLTSPHSSYVSLLSEPVLNASAAARISSALIGADSARAPPRS